MSTSNLEAGTKAPRGKRTPVLTISVTAMFTALVFVVTQFVWVPISAVPGQRFDAGDIIIFIAAWTFGLLAGSRFSPETFVAIRKPGHGWRIFHHKRSLHRPHRGREFRTKSRRRRCHCRGSF